MGVEDESFREGREDVPDKTEEPVEEEYQGGRTCRVEEVEVVPEEESVYAKKKKT